MFRKEEVAKIDRVLSPYRERWINSSSDVVELQADKKKAQTLVQKGPEKGPLAESEDLKIAEG